MSKYIKKFEKVYVSFITDDDKKGRFEISGLEKCRFTLDNVLEGIQNRHSWTDITIHSSGGNLIFDLIVEEED